MKIEVEWKVNIPTGITNIQITDLGVKNKKEWIALGLEEQKIRINKYLLESDQSMIEPLATDW